MKYRSVAISGDKKKSKFILIYSFITVISISTAILIYTKNNIDRLKTKEIPLLKSRLNTTNNSIAVETRNNSNLIRTFIKTRAKDLGMVKADYSDIIDIWWNKEN